MLKKEDYDWQIGLLYPPNDALFYYCSTNQNTLGYGVFSAIFNNPFPCSSL